MNAMMIVQPNSPPPVHAAGQVPSQLVGALDNAAPSCDPHRDPFA